MLKAINYFKHNEDINLSVTNTGITFVCLAQCMSGERYVRCYRKAFVTCKVKHKVGKVRVLSAAG